MKHFPKVFVFIISAAFLTLANYARTETGYTMAQVEAVNELALGCDGDWVCELDNARRAKK